MHEKHFKLPPTQRVIEQNILLYFISLPMQELLVSYEVSFYVNFPAVFFLLEKPYKINHSLCLINYWSGSSCLLQFSVILKVLFCSVEESYFKSLSGDKGVHTKFQANACGNTYGNLNATSVHWHFTSCFFGGCWNQRETFQDFCILGFCLWSLTLQALLKNLYFSVNCSNNHFVFGRFSRRPLL